MKRLLCPLVCVAVLMIGLLTLPASSGENDNKAWLAWGLYTDTYEISEALADCGIKAVASYIDSSGQLVPYCGDLKGFNLVVLSDVPARLINASQQYFLMRFVKAGGGLIVLGGPYGYGYGGLAGSFLEEMLPLEVLNTFDLVRIPEPGRVLTSTGQNMGSCCWIHKVKVSSGAKVVLTVEGYPFAVTGQYGKGRVVAVLGTVLGEPKEPFWTTPGWHDELMHLVDWAAGVSKEPAVLPVK